MVQKEEKNIRNDRISDRIIKYCEDILGFFPSIIETDYYNIDALRSMLSKNKIIWADKYFDGVSTIYNNGIIEFKQSEILFYFVKRENEITYKFYCLSKEESTDSILFYLNQLKSFKTIS
jgi:hypothetical protein